MGYSSSKKIQRFLEMSKGFVKLIYILFSVWILPSARANCEQMERYFLLSHTCDFYFEGYFNFPPTFVLGENTTYPPAIVARSGSPTASIGSSIASCTMYTPSPISFTASTEECPLFFTITKKRQLESGEVPRHAVGKSSGIEASMITIHLQNVTLEDGTVLVPGDGNTRFLESRRCVAFVRLPNLKSVVQGLKAVSTQFENFGTKVAAEFLKTMEEVEKSLNKALGHHNMMDVGMDPFGWEFP